MLIKSFEGFRPRAIQRAEGGWIIGYGHTLSAREGATVSESDAELLLRYDLLPVEASVNDTIPADLNQHQFDALVSFAFSVGVDRFAASDVRQRLTAGAPGEAADAIMGWPEPALPETALRRRAAERALFVANPAAPVALSDLLSAPLPPPPVPTPITAPEVEPAVEAEPAPISVEPVADVDPASPVAEAEPTSIPVEETVADTEPAATTEAEPEVDPVTPVDPRGAAVAALLGEPPVRLVQDEAPTIIPSFAPARTVVEADDALAPSNDNPPTDATDIEVETDAEPETDASSPTPAEAATESRDDASIITETDAAEGVAGIVETAETGLPAEVEDTTDSSVTWSADKAAWSVTRYAPYGLSMVGPLPDLPPAAPRAPAETPAIDHAVIDVPVSETEEATAADADLAVETVEAEIAPIDEVTVAPEAETPARVEAEAVQPTDDAAPAATGAVATIEERLAEVSALTRTGPVPAAPVEPMVYVAPAPVAELVLTPLDDAPEPLLVRPLWAPEERDAPDGSENNLFGEDLTLTLGGSVMRHEMEFEAPAKFDWKETAPFIFMGGVGLVSFGASMAAFRRAAEQSGGSELTIIGWVLALIGLGCVGVSSINLYRKFGLPGGD